MKLILRLHNIGELLTDGCLATITEDGKNIEVVIDADDLVNKGYELMEDSR